VAVAPADTQQSKHQRETQGCRAVGGGRERLPPTAGVSGPVGCPCCFGAIAVDHCRGFQHRRKAVRVDTRRPHGEDYGLFSGEG
ncbi:unnamed protein product, partial [Ectocarpus sp. 12 AP-2014]